MKKSEINILIIEDDKNLARALSEAVSRRGYKPIVAHKPDEAESIVKIKPVHAVIADCMLPGRNGVDLVLKLKENLMEDVVIIFVSGIFRDKAFAVDAVKKSEALDFFFKPYNIEELLKAIDSKLKDFTETPKIDLHTLLSTPFTSNRDRRKAFDHVEELSGFDLPFVFCILMDSESSGYLNMVDATQNIYGVTFAKGTIARVDSENTNVITKKLLIKHGFVTERDLNDLKMGTNKNDIVKALVDSGLMSPHVPQIIKAETIISELNKLILDAKLQVNFVPDRKIVVESDNVDVITFMPQLHDMIDRLVPGQWLKNFYSPWIGHPVRLGPQYQEHKQLLNFAVLRKANKLIEMLKSESPIEELLVSSGMNEDDFYKALHFLALRRVILFEEVKRVKNLDEHVNRLKNMHAALKGAGPIKIFQYFGLSDKPKHGDIIKIYKEFTRSNHPDTLPQSIASDIRILNTELFSWITSAYEILTNEDKKKAYFDAEKHAEAEKQIKSDDLVTAAAVSLSRGLYTEALPVLEKANSIFSSERAVLHLLWARFKVEGQIKLDELESIEKTLRGMSHGMKKAPAFIFVNALLKKAYGDILFANDEFRRILVIDPTFMDARRELGNAKLASIKAKSENIMTGDLSVVLKNIFKKKGA
jgi:DNA-binding response OmpR family regulator